MLNGVSLNRLLIGASILLFVVMAGLSAFSNRMLNGIFEHSGHGRTLHLAMLLAKEARFQTIQIQQFLTDAAATADEAAFAVAAQAMKQAHAALQDLAALQPAHADGIGDMRADVTRLHNMGVAMAHVYIDEGREAGNAIMKRRGDGFDAFAARLASRIDAVVGELNEHSVASLAQTTPSIALIRNLMNVSSVALLFVVVVGVSVVRRSFLLPILRLRESMREIAEGDGDLTRRLTVAGSNEIAQVSGSFNDFVERIRGMIECVAQDTAKLSALSEDLSHTSDGTQRRMRRLHEQTEAAAAAVIEMGATVQGVSESAGVAAESAEQSDLAAQNGREVVSATISAIDTLACDVDVAGKALGALDREVREVSDMLATIRDIAAQTNLLALNAAIEAARAGEHGRGFAVVADEVRKLAQRTHESTERIEHVIGRLQTGSEQAVAVMESGQRRAAETVRHAGAAGDALDEIVGAMGRIRQMVEQIAGTVVTQREAAGHLSASITAITEVADRTSDEARLTSHETADMAVLMGKLTTLVERFKPGHDLADGAMRARAVPPLRSLGA